jgi:sulfur-oxidizing protein SoxY
MNPLLFTRRHFLATGGALALTAATPGLASAAIAPLNAGAIAELIAERLGNVSPVSGALTLTLPALAESGNSVPMSVGIDTEQLDGDRVRRILVIATRNPRPMVLDAHFGPRSALPEITTNVRLAETQTIRALAQLESGTIWEAQADIEVTIGACQILDFRY